MSVSPLSALYDKYEEAATLWGFYMDAADSKRANIVHKEISLLFAEIRRRGPEAQESLLPLLNSDNLGVKLWAACHALSFAPALAETALRELMKTRGHHKLTAGITLEEWKAGRLKFE